MKAKRTGKGKLPQGYRYDKANWRQVIEPMLAEGLLYRQIASKLGVGVTTVARFVHDAGLLIPGEHRTVTRLRSLKELQPMTKHEDDIRRGLRPMEGGRK